MADTGCGIPDKIMKRLFDPFFSTKERGMGLGLAISYAIVKAHKGFIEVKSQPGKSTTFTIGIPAADQASASSASTPPVQQEHVSHAP
jgi:signal transduction histidine kinase